MGLPPNQPCLFPTWWGLLDFNIALRASFTFFFSSSPPRLLATSWSQWALLDLNCQLPISVGTAGPQPGLLQSSGHRWTSTRTSRAQWALLDLKRQIDCQNICQIGCQKYMPDRMPDRMSDRMPDRMSDRMPEFMSDGMPDRMPERMPKKKCQIEWQNICQIECQIECQIRMPDRNVRIYVR